MDFEAFKTWWLTEHTPKVKKWPGLVKDRINLCPPPDQAFDGVAEVLFKTRAQMNAVFATPEGQYARDGDLHRLEHRHPVDRRTYHRRVITASASHQGHLGTPAVVEAEDRRTPKSLKRGQHSSTAKGTNGTFLPFMS
jgi:hypothetical protein